MELMTAKETALRLRVTTRTLARWREIGTEDLPYVMLSAGAIRYPREGVEKFLESRMVGQVAGREDEN